MQPARDRVVDMLDSQSAIAGSSLASTNGWIFIFGSPKFNSLTMVVYT